MQEWFESLQTFEKVLWYIAIPFSLIFLIQLILSLSGYDGRKIRKNDPDDSDVSVVNTMVKKNLSFFSVALSLRNTIFFLITFSWFGIWLFDKGFSKNDTVLYASLIGVFATIVLTMLFYAFNKNIKQLK
jgi:uncharacterized membrane protein